MRSQQTNILQLITHFKQLGPVILLDSQMAEHSANERTYLAANPKSWIKSYGNRIEVMVGGEVSTFKRNPWKALSEFRDDHKDWMFGYLGYDMKNHLEDLDSQNPELISAPDMFFMIPENLISWDTNYQVKNVKGTIPQKFEREEDEDEFHLHFIQHISREEYCEIIERTKKEIFEGSYYEINLSHPLEFDFKGNSLALYLAMKEIGPVPFAAYMDIGDLSVCCSSPERFIAKSKSRVWSQPIKGTASRNYSDAGIDTSAEELKNSEKERAENLMIVDLVRNDLSKIAINNSVQVTDLFEIQSFKTVHQMVSTIECKVADKTDAIEIVKACFPMGSMTGAPKIAAMKAIERYENYKRGLYSGSIGYIEPNGDFDFNVIIRTALIQGNKLIYPVGGAITSDSDPAEEWEETLIKARALTNV